LSSNPVFRSLGIPVFIWTNKPSNAFKPTRNLVCGNSRRFSIFFAVTCFFAFHISAYSQSTIFPSSSTPSLIDSNDAKPVELGLKFKSDTSGLITGIRFYKAAKNTGTHVAHLWSTSGTLLGSATFTSESASGWQQVNFAQPITVSANTIYIASYFAPVGHYSANTAYFSKRGVDNTPLHALADGVSGTNGVYYYSSNPRSGGFPSNGYQATNYWVDVVFQTAQAPPTGTPQLTSSSTSLSFGNVAVNSTSVKSIAFTSSGAVPVTVKSASVSGTGFSLVAGTFPATLAPKQSLTLQVQFAASSAKSMTGTLTVMSNSATNPTMTVALSGTGMVGNSQLTLSATTLSFGGVAVNSTASQTLTLTASGTSPVTVNSASIQGNGFSLIGGSFPITLNPQQSTALQIQFKPTAAGAMTGALAISSNASGSPVSVSLNGTGTTAAREIDLSWDAAASASTPIAGYNIYRSVGGGGFQLLNSSVVAQTSYADKTVTSGTTYNFYVKTVDQNKVESAASNRIALTVP